MLRSVSNKLIYSQTVALVSCYIGQQIENNSGNWIKVQKKKQRKKEFCFKINLKHFEVHFGIL